MSRDNSRRQMLGLTIYLKHEVEKHSSIKINIHDGLNLLQDEMAKKGCHIPDEYLRKIVYGMASYKDWPYYSLEDGQEEVDEDDVPMPMVYGVTTFLCGFFLYCCPVPACKPIGKTLMSTGGALCLKTMAETHEEKKQARK